jgi:ATP-dependent DNA helicase RecQ
VHKVASILLMEDVKPDQFLMLTFSRQAAEEMKSRLARLIGPSVYGVDIKTFHSYAFNLTGLKGDLDHSVSIIIEATTALREEGPLFPQVSMKQVIVVDEFQDVDTEQFAFLNAIVDLTTDARVVVVGDDDQNIYEFRGSSVKFMRQFAASPECNSYFLTTNFRSKRNLVEFTNAFLNTFPGDRLKAGQELIPYDQRKGELVINHYPSNAIPAQQLAQAIHANPRTQSIAILTRTNEEALQINAILHEMDIPVNLVLDRSGYQVSHILEFETFSFILKEKAQKGTGYINHKDWNTSLKKIQKLYRYSNVLKEIHAAIKLFSSNREHFYLADWLEYLRGLRDGDLIIQDVQRVWISTMHKSKGKEFNSVFLYLDNLQIVKPQDYRLLYVALTRAKENLHVYTNASELRSVIGNHGDWVEQDDPHYTLNKVYLQFGLEHIYLGGIKNQSIQHGLQSVSSGEVISLDSTCSYAVLPDGQKISLSNKARDLIKKWEAKGYEHEATYIDRIVVWREKDDPLGNSYRVPVLRVHLMKGRRND